MNDFARWWRRTRAEADVIVSRTKDASVLDALHELDGQDPALASGCKDAVAVQCLAKGAFAVDD